ncbi:hypothetical protein ACOSZP_20900 [Vibrio fluvialis]
MQIAAGYARLQTVAVIGAESIDIVAQFYCLMNQYGGHVRHIHERLGCH